MKVNVCLFAAFEITSSILNPKLNIETMLPNVLQYNYNMHESLSVKSGNGNKFQYRKKIPKLFSQVQYMFQSIADTVSWSQIQLPGESIERLCLSNKQ